MKLYKLKTRVFECYCVAETYDAAVNKFYSKLAEQCDGCSYDNNDKFVISVEVVADESVYGFANLNNLGEGSYTYKLLA